MMLTWSNVLRRRSSQPGWVADVWWEIEANGVIFDGLRRRVQVDGYLVHLPAREAAVLSLLMTRPGQVVHRCALLSAAWGTGCTRSSALDRLLRRLQRRLAPSPVSPIRIHRVGDNGYVFGASANYR
ncbi:MAG: winged helix-turn-helix domain-containing protein [Pseudonocardiaceae bacterium]|jgi:DNA-binding response OmpR family regulator